MIADDHEARAARARARAGWKGGVRPLAGAPEVELIDLPAAELFGLVYALTLEAWAFSGKPIPDYGRNDMPGRVVRRDPG